MKKKYLTFTVRAAYQPKDDTIHLTSKDLEGNWHVTLNRHTEAETLLRQELIAADLISPSQVDIPVPAEYPVNNTLQWNQFPLGVTRGNQPVIWNLQAHPHMLLAGPSGSGKSVIERALIFHTAQHPEWHVVGIDLKRVELALYRNVPALKNRIQIAVDLETAVAALQQVYTTLLERYALMEAAGVNHFTHLYNPETGRPPRPVLLLIDEAFLLLSPEGAKTGEGKQRDQWHGEALQLVTNIAALGRAAGIHIALGTQRPDATVLPGSLTSLLEMRVAAGRLNLNSSLMVLDSRIGTDLPAIKGRGIVLGAGHTPAETQFYWSAPADINRLAPYPTSATA